MPTATPTTHPNPAGGAARRWLRRAAYAVIALLLLWALLWLAGPPALKALLERQGSAQLGRKVTVESIDLRPWSLRLTVKGLRVHAADGQAVQFELARLEADAELQSVLRLAPVLDSLTLEAPRLRLAHLGEGRYDIDDLLLRLQSAPASPKDPKSDLPRFAVYNIAVHGGEFDLRDAPKGITHTLRGLELGIPFLSNLGARREVFTQPKLAFALNGEPFALQANTRPFAADHKSELVLDVPRFAITPYLPYWPTALPLRPEAGELTARLTLAFEQQQTTSLSVAGDLALRGLRLTSRGQPLFGLETLELKIEPSALLDKRINLARLALAGPQLQVRRDAAGRIDLLEMVQAFAPASPTATAAAKPTAAPGAASPAASATASAASGPALAAAPAADGWQLALRELRVDGGRVDWSDASTQPAAKLSLEDLKLAADGVAWPTREAIPFEGGARLAGAAWRWKGQATAQSVNLSTQLDDLPLAAAAPYLAGVLKPRVTGALSVQAEVAWKDGSAPVLRLPLARVRDLVLADGAVQPLAWRSLTVDKLELDLGAQRASAASVVLDRPRMQAERSAQGRWMLEDWLVQATPATEDTTSAPAWQLTLGEARIDGGQLGFVDLAAPEPVRLELSAIELQLRTLAPLAASQAAMPLRLALQMRQAGSRGDGAQGGSLSYTGSITLPGTGTATPMRTQGRVQADHLPVHALEPYLRGALNLDLLRADTSFDGTVQVALPPAGPDLSLEGQLSVEDLRARTLSPGEDLLDWKALNLRGLNVQLQGGQLRRLVVNETVLSDFFVRVIVGANGRINLQDLLRPDGAAPGAATAQAPASAAAGQAPAATATPTATATAAAPAPSASATVTTAAAATGPAPEIRFGPISLVNGRVFYSDRFIQPNYSANLSALAGGLGAFTNRADAAGAPVMADLSLRGRVEGTASLEVEGKLNPLAQPLALDLKGKVRELELAPLSPYSGKYAGYGIERGKLSLDVAYRITPEGQLTASNQVVLNQLMFGERVEGSLANLPVKLAVALLADRNGVIDINLPISGSINDPQFRLGPIIIQVIFNLIGKAITAPFALLASAFGGGPELSEVDFAAGRAELDATARERLDKVAKALVDRTGLRLTVVGRSNPEAEQAAWRRARLDDTVQSEKRRQAGRSGGTPSAAEVTVSPAEYPALLQEVYRRADIAKPRTPAGAVRDLPQADLEALLMAAVPVGQDALRDLAVARSVAVRDYLAAQKVPAERLFLGAPVALGDGKGSGARAELTLAPR